MKPTTVTRLGGVTAGVCVIGAVYLVWSAQQARTNRAVCLDRLRVMGGAIRVYLADNDEIYPPVIGWQNALKSVNSSLQGCPSARPGQLPPQWKPSGVEGYAWNPLLGWHQSKRTGEMVLVALSDVPHPAQTINICEQAVGIERSGSRNPYTALPVHPRNMEDGWTRHSKGAHYLFCDGHAQWLPPEKVEDAEDGHANNGKQPTFNVE